MERRALSSEVSPNVPRESLEWLSTEKLLELIAHDINNLCHAALSYIDLASDPAATPESRARFLATSKNLVYRASRFTPHLRTLSELRAGDLKASPSEALTVVFEVAQARAATLNPGATIDVKRTGTGWDRRVAGGKYVAAVLGDLLDNSVRFARPGTLPKIVVDATVDGSFMQITVKDNGKGFAKGQEHYATKRFSQPGVVSGAGIGLAAGRLLAERTGGSLHVGTPDKGGGALVTLRLPLAPPA